MNTYKPLGNRVLVERIEAPETARSGLFVLGREVPNMAKIIAIGPGPRDRRGDRQPITDLRVGDDVTFEKFSIECRYIGDTRFAILDYDDLILRKRSE